MAFWGIKEEGAGIYINCSKCLIFAPLSFLTGLWLTRYSAENYTILHAFEWCISRFLSCDYQTITLFSDFQSFLSTLGSKSSKCKISWSIYIDEVLN